MKKQNLYKILDKNGYSCNGGNMQWSLSEKQKDGSWKPGKWMPNIQGELIACENGYHLCREKDLLFWFNESIYEVEYKGEIIESNNKVVVQQARLLCKYENWDERTARLFACWCVRNTPLENGGTIWDLLVDNRSKNAVKVAEQFANGKATREELDTAWATAWDARDTARATTWGAEWAAARAARDAAKATAWDAAWAATRAARDAARSATRTAWSARAAVRAAWTAARGAAWSIAWDAQTKELLRILNEVQK